ncbi:diguanylate cyclase [Pseudoalteromonas sp. NZS127_1]|uniref:ligand-binding sensor domain-containing diguanylate cyclase n=1 Tax=unclassified Pseudoalteromonas TaxID=194690 RepID=UPI00040977D5|nr:MULTISPECIES: ligand-binding sensor domain-containing diguanylate cyclase [unclassified Pseudoalteromonas]MBG9995664.1 diguanylate cyclase [Pseudoalteromonas sp. NZS127_1]MBH0014004.1 diguanylate cyclase [Pseudoalteromonas sp. NZS100_1]MBH0043655.1 diguanylate cyclase [Pseudoalteromonas sp. SWXJZ10B]MBH0049198.1 diguanylate cyclase [Pseudoalteromonas sp. SWYJZ19]MBH0075507.1 diguanylate cyclase [Pseudoalteromonas sp. SWYJ118]
MMRFLLVCVLMLCATPSWASISDYVVKQWNIKDGLPSQSLKSVVQDQQGYMWLGTQFGLSRFDGTTFTNYNTQNSPFLPSNGINKLLVDSSGLLWVGTKSGLVVINPATFAAQEFNIKGPVRDILEDSKGSIWIAANGLYYVDRGQVDLRTQVNGPLPIVNATVITQIVGSVSQMALSPEGIWLVNDRHLLRLTKNSSDFSKLRLELTAKISLPERLAQTIVHDLSFLNGNLYIASELGAYFLDLDDELRPFPLPNANNSAVYKFMSDTDGGLWVSTYGRLLFRDKTGEWQWVEPSQLDQSIWFADIFRDDKNNVWLASFSEGLWLAHEGRVERHSAVSDMTESVMAISQAPDGKLWVANKSGIGYFDLDKSFINLVPSSKYGYASVHDLQFDGERLYIATGRGLFVFENKTLYTVPGRALRDNPVFAISRSSKGGFWIGTGRGLYRLNYAGLTPFAYNAFLGSKFITYVLDKTNFGVIGTSKGAYYFTDRGIEKIGDQTTLESAYVTSVLHIDGVGILIGSLNDGLFYRSTQGQWRQLDAANGLPYGSIFSLEYDEKLKHVWVSTMKGVYRMPVEQFKTEIKSLKVEEVISSFDRQLDGKANQCCSGLGHDAVADTGNSIWYPSLQGVVEIPKNVELFGVLALKPTIETITTPLRHLTTAALGKKPSLETDERDITLTYTAIDYYAPNSIEFRYKLSGLDSDWRYANTRREAIYTNLPPGSFLFQLEAKRQGEDWTKAQEVEYGFVVPERFDETIYFRLLITSGFILLFYLIFWVFRAQERRKQEALEGLITERTLELRQANDKLGQVNSQLKLVSHSDELTGLRSRRFLFDQLPKDIEHFQRNSQSLQAQGKSLVLVIINFDNFSRINDAYGPIAGDSCLQQMAALLNSRTQGSDYVARWSGDEFLLLLRDFKCNKIDSYASDLCKVIAANLFQLPNGKTTNITASIGWSFYPLPLLGGQVISWETSINLADISLHQVKKRGGDGVANITFDDQLDAFEFEQNSNVDQQLGILQSNGLADIKVWMR